MKQMLFLTEEMYQKNNPCEPMRGIIRYRRCL